MSSRPPEPNPDPLPPTDRTHVVDPAEIVRRLGKLTVFRTQGRTARIDTPSPTSDVTAVAGDGFPTSTLPTDRYELLGEYARGGMGVVLRARDRVIGRELAIKVPASLDGWTPAAEARFLREARITGQLQHPGIVPVYDVGRFPDGRPFMAMRLVRGRSLDDLLTARPDPAHDRDRWVGVFEQVCQPVAYAHSKGVIHRDLKPHNVVLSGSGQLWVLDWGLARVLHEDGPAEPVSSGTESRIWAAVATYTVHGAALGTPAYMAPEQARGETGRVDERADVFALGGVLCQVLTGLPPFVHADPRELWRRNLIGDVADAHVRLDASGADPGLIELAKLCLSPEPEDRPRDAREVAWEVATIRAGRGGAAL